MEPDAMADLVVLTIKSALATALTPVLERMAAAEARLAVLGDLRDRVVTVEAKAALPPALDPALSDLRDRVLAVEHKAAPDVPAEVLTRLAAVEARPAVAVSGAEMADLRDRIVTLETRSAGPSVTDMALVDVRERFAALERRVNDDALAKDFGALRERLAVLEVRGQVPGPAGKDGLNGKDGVGFDDLSVDFDGDRTIALTFVRGVEKKTFPIALPFLRYQGVYEEGKSYDEGDVVTWAGSTWTAKEATATRPGDGSQGWQLCVKKGRDGRDGADAPGARPVVSVGGRG
jgi:hypothetical protein